MKEFCQNPATFSGIKPVPIVIIIYPAKTNRGTVFISQNIGVYGIKAGRTISTSLIVGYWEITLLC